MTGKDYLNRLRTIYKDVKTVGVENLRFRCRNFDKVSKTNCNNYPDKDHLNCFWSVGNVVWFDYSGYQVVINSAGDVKLSGRINGDLVSFGYEAGEKDIWKDCSFIKGDDDLQRLLNSEDENNFIILESSSHFEFYLMDSQFNFVDVSKYGNILCDNLFDCLDMDHLNYYISVVDKYKEDKKAKRKSSKK